ncbi:MAM and LDL-receptor class A domain-containing protein 1 [Gastrophryne carolinensis]
MIEEDNRLRLLLSADEGEDVLFEENLPTNGQWLEGNIKLPEKAKNIQLIFEGTIKSIHGFIALGGFRLTNCENEKSLEISSNDDRSCFTTNTICDFQIDCEDKRDEDPVMCSTFQRCDFESGLCGWKPMNINGLVWTVRHGQSRGGLLPSSDHTSMNQNVSNPGMSSTSIRNLIGGQLTWLLLQIYIMEYDKALLTKVSNQYFIGHFVQVSMESGTGEEISTLQLKSHFFLKPLAAAVCQIQFWFQLSENSKILVLKRGLINEDLKILQEVTGATAGRWTKAVVDIRTSTLDSKDPPQIILAAVLLSAPAMVAIDDISLSPACGFLTNNTYSDQMKESLHFNCPFGSLSCGDGSCIPWKKRCDFRKDCANGLDELMCAAKCDFESDTCGWYERGYADSFYWVHQSPSTLQPEYSSQAPSQDHSLNSSKGHFMFIQQKENDISQSAELRSPKFSQAGAGCSLTFWYYNYGSAVGAAEILLHMENEDTPTVVWRTYYSQGNQWRMGFIQLDRLSHPFSLSVNKISMGLYKGVSAIDDIAFENCSLPPAASTCNGSDHFWCTDTKACISILLVCDLIDDCGDGSDEINCTSELQCDFEDGLCNWTQDSEDDFDWTRYQGQTPTLDTGPMRDHTLGSVKGHYLYIETSEPQMYGNQAVLLSPEIGATANQQNKTCVFRFHYHMFGKQIYSLAVYKRTIRNTRGQLLWQAFGNKGNRWLKKLLYITSAQPFQLLVIAKVGDGFTGDIGIDDLSFLNCILYEGILPTWSPVPLQTSTVATLPTHNCKADEYACRFNGHCIPNIKQCDFQVDCLDGSDETYCVSEYCSFENGSMCQWFQPGATSFRPDAVFHWEVGQGITIHPGEESHRPGLDHTISKEDGWYLYADSSNGNFGHTAYIMTPLISQTGPKCKLTFWCYMNGATVGSLQVLINFGNMTYELWSQSGKHGAQWKKAEVYLGTLSDFQIVLEAKRGVSYVGDVAVDDVSFEDCAPIQIKDQQCTSQEYMCANKYCIPKNNVCDFVNDCSDNSDENPYLCRAFLGRCNFEFDLCDWKQDQNDDFDWNLRAGRTPTLGTGPVTDHTMQKPYGSYIFIESSFPHLPRQSAKLFGPMVSKWSRNCKLIFYFHMHGEGIGSLTVTQVTLSRREVLLLNLMGDQGNYWQRKELDLLELGEDFYVIFEGKVGRERGDIAMDDIVLSNDCLPSEASFLKPPREWSLKGFCPPGLQSCNNKRCYRSKQRCDFVNDCKDNTDENDCGTSCTFELGMCGWKNSLADNFDWIVGGNSSQTTKPSMVDHTIGNEQGHFLYLETSLVGLRGEKAHLKSSIWKESGKNCTLIFWYYMSAKALGQIQVLIKTEMDPVKIWGESENQDGKWNKVEIHLGKLRNFQVIFEGVRTRDFGGGAAIDDIQFANCSTVGEEPGKCPGDTDFICKNKKCIEAHLVCDYKPDCEDSSDEADCGAFADLPGNCNFEDQNDGPLSCDVLQDKADDFDWSLAQRGAIQLNEDHTPGHGKWFLYANTSGQQAGDIARILTSKFFNVTGETCMVRFWYYIYGPPLSGNLKVFIVTEYGLKILQWMASKSTEGRWMYSSLILSSRSSPFKVAFEAQLGANASMDIALDDISFTSDCYLEYPMLPKPSCPEDLFTCAYKKQCVLLSAKCNGRAECSDGTDEILCPTSIPITTLKPLCKHTEFLCANNQCIPLMMSCDGVIDCFLGDDEKNCTVTPSVATNGSFLCVPSNSWLTPAVRCDGKPDCNNLVDESLCSECPKGYCKNGGKCVVEKEVPVCRIAVGHPASIYNYSCNTGNQTLAALCWCMLQGKGSVIDGHTHYGVQNALGNNVITELFNLEQFDLQTSRDEHVSATMTQMKMKTINTKRWNLSFINQFGDFCEVLAQTGEAYSLLCTRKWQGSRCHISAPRIPPAVTEADTRGMWIGIGIGLACLAIELVIVFMCYFNKNPASSHSQIPKITVSACSWQHKGELTGGFSNPNYNDSSVTSEKEVREVFISHYSALVLTNTMNKIYETEHPNVSISVFPWRAVHKTSKKAPKACSFPNPLYGNKEDL